MGRSRPIPPGKAAVVSVHDVMADNLHRVKEIVRILERKGVVPATFLVVPGCSWSDRQIRYLQTLQERKFELAGHGWSHRAPRPKTPYHRLHALLVSRNEAEHLSLAKDRIRGIIRSCYKWFIDSGLKEPALYVPPAWAWGALGRKDFQDLPFRFYETQWSVYDAAKRAYRRLPVAGYQADTRLRQSFLGLSNRINTRLLFSPVRLAIHPPDLELGLFPDLLGDLERARRFLRYCDLF